MAPLHRDNVEFSPCPSRCDCHSRQTSSLPDAVQPPASDTPQGLQQSPDSPHQADPRIQHTGPCLATPDGPVTPPRRTDKSDQFVILSPPSKNVEDFPKDTPFSKKIAGVPESFEPNKADDMNKRHVQQQVRVVVGPIPVKTFFKEFFRRIPKDKPMPNPKNAFKKVPRNPKREKDVYDPLIRAINYGKYCPSIKFYNTSMKPERGGRGARKTDCMGYSVIAVIELKARQKKRKTKKWILPTNLGLPDVFFEIKPNAKDDPFCDLHEHGVRIIENLNTSFLAFENHMVNDTAQGEKQEQGFGQLTAYAAEVCERQHRTHFFSAMITGTRARLYRWDRAGVIVTESFDYQEEPELLCEFLWRLHLASPVERGYDPTVTIASQEEEELFKKLISEEVAFQLNIDVHDEGKLNQALNYHYQEGKVTKIEVYNEKTSQLEYFLVSVPIVSPKSAAGRGTRGYWAVRLISPDEGQVCFLKDTWRVDVPGMTEEGLIYEEMQGKVDNICKVYAHGHVLNVDNESLAENSVSGPSSLTAPTREIATQSTRTQDFVETKWFCACLKCNPDTYEEDYKRRIIRRVHYRLILEDVGYPLTEFESASELFGAAKDALGALSSAYNNCRRLHRDVGIGNIVLSRCKETGQRRGLVVDWESSTLAENTRRARDYFRSVQWAFASGESLQREHDFLHTRDDDTESLFYVVMYGCIRWIPHNEKRNLGQWIYKFFDCFNTANGYAAGGEAKCNVVWRLGKPFLNEFQFTKRYIQRWFSNGYGLLSTRKCYIRNAMPNQWSANNLMELLDYVYNELLDDDVGRCEHDVSDYHQAMSQVRHATHTTLQKASGVKGVCINGPMDHGSGRKRGTHSERPSTKRQRTNYNSGDNSNGKHVRRSVRLLQKGEGIRRSARLANKNTISRT